MRFSAVILNCILLLSSASAAVEEHYVLIDAVGMSTRELSRHVSIDHGRQKIEAIRAYATGEQLQWLDEQGYTWSELPHPASHTKARMGLYALQQVTAWDAYPTYGEYLQMMQDYADNYPDLARLIDIGDTQNGRELWVLKITDNPDSDEDEPEVFYTSTMHGDETTGYVLMLHLIDELLTQHGSDPQITALVDESEIWINPLANPDGTYHGGNDSVGGAWRGLANGWDPNRNFPDPQDGDHPDGHTWATETLAMMGFAQARNFVLSANFHGGAEVFNYPWDTWNHDHADLGWWITVGHQYADQAQADGPSGYMSSFDDGITNGYDWYEVNGGRQDYMNYWHGCREVTIELSDTKSPAGSSLPTYWNANRQSLLDYLDHARSGVRGIVSNDHGQLVPATVEIPGHDVDGSMVYTDMGAGNYHRMVAPGTYDLRFTAANHQELLVEDVVVSSGSALRLDVEMVEILADPVFASGFE